MKSKSFIYIIKLLFSIILLISARQDKPYDDERKYFPLLMPNVQPVVKDIHLCTAFQMPKNDFKYIVEFTPNASMENAHHILIDGCEIPGRWERDTPRLVWECEDMIGIKSGYTKGPTCNSGTQRIYAWARDAPRLQLPEGIGFKVGQNSGINFLVLQVHYSNVDKFVMGGTDDSGIILTMLPSTTDKITKAAGVYVLGNKVGMIQAGEEKHFESACRIEETIQIHPFAFRTHTHALGKVVSGYKIDKDNKWHLIGKHNPQEPQMFYPVEDTNMIIEYGDIVAARCTMYNFRDTDTYIGHTGNNEMCNFYMMYYVDGDRLMQQKTCLESGRKTYYWNTDSKIDYVPKDIDLSASTLNQ